MLHLESDRIFKSGEHLCCDCLALYKHTPLLTVTCSVCNKKYQGLDDWSDDMGLCCSAIIFKDEIEAGYGSKYDSDKLTLKSNPVTLQSGKNICDTCIAGLITNGICEWNSYDHHLIPIRSGPIPMLQ